MRLNIFELITPANISAYWDDTKANQSTYLGELLFPATKIAGLELNKIGGHAGLPVQLKASAFDTQATYRDRMGIEVHKTRLPFFRERMKIDEETRQQILSISNDTILRDYVSRVFDDTNNLLKGARAARERMAMELLATGMITINGNGVKMTYNYGMNNKQKVKPTVAWTDTANSKPLQDLANWVDYARTKFHVNLGYAIMTTKTFNLIKSSESTIATIYPLAQSTGKLFVTTPQVKEIITATTGLTVLINDNAYADSVGGAAKQFFPDNVVTLIPAGNGVIGQMVFGTTPEEIDLASRAKTADSTRIVDTGVAVYTRLIDHPVNVETIVSQIVLPSLSGNIEDGAGTFIIGQVD